MRSAGQHQPNAGAGNGHALAVRTGDGDELFTKQLLCHLIYAGTCFRSRTLNMSFEWFSPRIVFLNSPTMMRITAYEIPTTVRCACMEAGEIGAGMAVAANAGLDLGIEPALSTLVLEGRVTALAWFALEDARSAPDVSRTRVRAAHGPSMNPPRRHKRFTKSSSSHSRMWSRPAGRESAEPQRSSPARPRCATMLCVQFTVSEGAGRLRERCDHRKSLHRRFEMTASRPGAVAMRPSAGKQRAPISRGPLYRR